MTTTTRRQLLGKVKPRRKGLAALLTHHTFRRLAQLGVFKGWMTLDDISTAYKVPVAEILAAFKLPADTPGTTQVKSLESDTFSTTNLRTWLQTRLGQ